MNTVLPPPIIAIVGCDGSGKSTVSEHLIQCVSKYGPVARVHLGKQAGNVGRRLIQLPFLGRSFSKAIVRNKAGVSRKKPGSLAAFVIMSFVLRRLFRFRRMLALRKRGAIILADRFPQIQIPGAFDGIQLPASVPGKPVITWLAGREYAAFKWMTDHKPDLVIKLNVDLDVACARKPDHRREALAKKIAVTPQLLFEGARIINIDTNQPLADVFRAAEAAISLFMESRGYRYAGSGDPAIQ